jgi:GT2 family glycosyltransferase
MKLTIGFVAFNNLKYTRLCIQSFRDTTKTPFDFFIVDGGSTDETKVWLENNEIPHTSHSRNMGSCVGVNDIYEYALKNDGDYLLLCGNDVMAYPGAVDEMVRVAQETKADWVWANEMRVSDFCGLFQEYADPKWFDENYRLIKDTFMQYLAFIPTRNKGFYSFEPTKDYRNFCLISKSMIDLIGLSDVNYYPSGYYEDNDYCRRAILKKAKAVMVESAWFFHFWSRSLFEGGIEKTYEKYLAMNEQYYMAKWGGGVGHEKNFLPFGSRTLKIPNQDRSKEIAIVDHWSGK